MSSAQARAVRPRSQPTSTGSPEKPYPGREGSTRWKASSALPPCVELRLGLAPVVVGLPVARELLNHRQLDALRPICDQLPGGQARRGDPAAQLGELLFGSVDVEGTDVGGGLGGAQVSAYAAGRRSR